jgi:2-polyprenyl-3-methyl-5-hydroxy-6-metoxy-1,4-benzoquinol methylase
MRNILDDTPTTELHGIPLQATRLVADDDLDGQDVLDVGCGFGWFELFALAHGVRTITGIELTERDLETARANVDAPNVQFQIANAIELPFNDASFDTVVCWEVLEHIPVNTEPRAFHEIARVLRPGGRLYLSTPHASLTARVFDPAWWLIGHRHYTTLDLERLAKNANLSVGLLEVRGGPLLIASILNLYIAKWVFRRSPFFEQHVNHRVDVEIARVRGSAGCFMKATAIPT